MIKAAEKPSLRHDSRCGISILFATHNGERTLPILLDALTKLKQPGIPWEVVAVDNASTDATPQILREAAKKLPLRVLASPRPGKHEAIKRGAELVGGDLVLFTDDDVKPSPDWLTAYVDAANVHQASSLFGGPIIPAAIEPVSPWFDASFGHHEVLFARSQHPAGEVDATAFLYGPNFLIRSTEIGVLDEIPANLGPAFDRPTNYAMGVDSGNRASSRPQGRATNIRARRKCSTLRSRLSNRAEVPFGPGGAPWTRHSVAQNSAFKASPPHSLPDLCRKRT